MAVVGISLAGNSSAAASESSSAAAVSDAATAAATASDTSNAAAILPVLVVVWIVRWRGGGCWGRSGNGGPGWSSVRISPTTPVAAFDEQGLIRKQIDL